jgi:hypothetical protein
MKHTLKIAIGLILFIALSAYSNRSNGENSLNYNPDLLNLNLDDTSSYCYGIQNWPENINSEEKDMLIYMREEEKLARDVYTFLYQKYGWKIFDNISKSEERHMNSVLNVMNHYNIKDPVINQQGAFSNPEIQKLYQSLTEKGSVSINEALLVGASIEDLDIYDLNQSLLKVENNAISTVFENIRSGSYNHLRAFSRQLNQQNEPFIPQHISAEEYALILEDQNGPANQNGYRNGQRCGQGNGNQYGYRAANRNCKGNGQKANKTGNGRRNGNCNGQGPNWKN